MSFADVYVLNVFELTKGELGNVTLLHRLVWMITGDVFGVSLLLSMRDFNNGDDCPDTLEYDNNLALLFLPIENLKENLYFEGWGSEYIADFR